MTEPQKEADDNQPVKASSAIWAGLKYGILAVIVYYIFKWFGWVG